MIALVDYGLGNVQAFANVYRRLGVDIRIARTSEDLQCSSRIILPGVGAFDWAMTRLQESGLREALDDQVLVAKKPVLGVCVGMQMMARSSEEGQLPGLGWIDAAVVKFNKVDFRSANYLPHMGWNDARPLDTKTLFAGIEAPRYYFLHSYIMQPDRADDILATASYGITFTAAARSGNVYGTQFHPEKSHQWGVQLLKNFAELC